MDRDDINKILLEIVGFRPSNANFNIGLYDLEPSTSMGHTGPTQREQPFKTPFQLADWQLELRNRILNRPRQDVFINIMPAAGKTLPVVSAWMLSSGYNHPVSFDKICWVCPTVQLSNQVFHSDLKKAFLKVLESNIDNALLRRLIGPLPALAPSPYINPPLPTPIDYKNIPNEHILPTIQRILDQRSCLRTGSGSIGNVTRDLYFSVCTYPFAPKIIEVQQPNIVVIDELQQYFPIYQNKQDEIEKAEQFTDTLRAVPESSSLILLTGSMNRESCDLIREFINKKFNRRLIYVNQPDARNRAKINIIPHKSMKRDEDLQNIVKNCVHQRSDGNCIVVFNVDRKVIGVAQHLIKVLPQRSIEAVTGVRPTIDDSKIYKQSDTDVNVISRNLSLNQAINHLSNEYEQPQFIANWLQHMLNTPADPQNYQHMFDRSKNNPNQFENISDPLLARCILCGFGYLAGGSRRDRKMTNRDIMIVQNLFKKGKIFCLLATDMIGVGTTLTIKNLYIPTLQKAGGEGGYGPIDDSSLVQLLHRAGRSGDITANIFCDESNFSRIYHIINSNPEDNIDPVIFGGKSSDFEKYAASPKAKIKHILTLLRGRYQPIP